MDDNYGSCMVDLTSNYPLIDYQSNQILKIDQIVEKLDLETIKDIYGTNIFGLEKKIINSSIHKLKQLPDLEFYLYRNYLNRNYLQSMDWAIQMSVFKDINFKDFVDYEANISNMLELINLTYRPYINILKESNILITRLEECFNSIPIDCKKIYSWISEYTKAANEIIEIHLK